MPNLPAPIFADKKLTVSADGSVTFYNMAYEETYRAKSVGAFTESCHKFVNASGILNKAKLKDVRILDLCFGLGYNCAVTFDYANRDSSRHKIHIVSIEKDAHLPVLVADLKILWPVEGFRIVRGCLKNGFSGRFSMEMYLMEALIAIYNISGVFDAIYFDPFSISKNPEMWTTDVFRRMRELLADDGALVTYACGKTVRGNMTQAGLKIGNIETVRGAFLPGTKATPA
jgi:chorismate dehydratase